MKFSHLGFVKKCLTMAPLCSNPQQLGAYVDGHQEVHQFRWTRATEAKWRKKVFGAWELIFED